MFIFMVMENTILCKSSSLDLLRAPNRHSQSQKALPEPLQQARTNQPPKLKDNWEKQRKSWEGPWGEGPLPGQPGVQCCCAKVLAISHSEIKLTLLTVNKSKCYQHQYSWLSLWFGLSAPLSTISKKNFVYFSFGLNFQGWVSICFHLVQPCMVHGMHQIWLPCVNKSLVSWDNIFRCYTVLRGVTVCPMMSLSPT